MKFVLDCDDGNNDDGDGCSRDCRVENGYVCRGGSPENKDNCIIFFLEDGENGANRTNSHDNKYNFGSEARLHAGEII